MAIPSPQIPSPYAAPPPRSSPLKWIVIGCLGMMLLGGLGIGGCLFAVIKATAAPVQAAENFLRAMNKGDFAEAKKFCDPTMDPKTIQEMFPGAWGETWTITERFISANNGVTTARVGASMKGTDGKSRTVHMVLAKTGEAWLVTGVSPDGPSGAEPGSVTIGDAEIQKKKIDNGWEVTAVFRVTGLKSESRPNGQVRVAASQGVLLLGPKKQEVIKNDDFKTIDGEANAAVVTFTNTFTLTGSEVDGHWVIRVKVTDHLSGKSATRDFEFEIP